MLCFKKLVGETQMSNPQDVKTTFKQDTTCIFLSVRHELLLSVHFETPCKMFVWVTQINCLRNNKKMCFIDTVYHYGFSIGGVWGITKKARQRSARGHHNKEDDP